ncbi:MAG: TIGR04255 family protein, partial [Candidatus Angelobacter sp.]
MRTLPAFTNPPIDELVLSLQFATLERLKSAHIGMFWETIVDRFPNVSEQPPLQPAFETFGGIRTEPSLGIR